MQTITRSTKNTMGVTKTLPSTDTVIAALSPSIQKRDSRHALTDLTIYRSAHIKRLWGYAKTRYCGLAKNTNRLVLMCALLNIRHYGKPLTG